VDGKAPDAVHGETFGRLRARAPVALLNEEGKQLKQVLATVLSNSQVRPNIYLLGLQAPEIASKAEPGQFVMVRTGEDHDPLLRRPLAIHRVSPLSRASQVSLLFSVVGRGTEWLARRAAGDTIDVLGPLGRGFDVRADDLLLVAGGIGIAPLVALADAALAAGARVTLILGAPTRDDLYPTELLPSQVKLHLATEDGSAGEKGMATDLLADLASGFDQVFACGPLAMYQAMSSHNSLKGKSVQVSLETRMGCGFGVCLGCAIETKQGMKLVCRDGPVFELEDIVWAAVEGGH
jgi:dihydroorotate dehydrogenase electron transfer subunit